MNHRLQSTKVGKCFSLFQYVPRVNDGQVLPCIRWFQVFGSKLNYDLSDHAYQTFFCMSLLSNGKCFKLNLLGTVLPLYIHNFQLKTLDLQAQVSNRKLSNQMFSKRYRGTTNSLTPLLILENCEQLSVVCFPAWAFVCELFSQI